MCLMNLHEVLQTLSCPFGFDVGELGDGAHVANAVDMSSDLLHGQIPIHRSHVLQIDGADRHLIIVDLGRVGIRWKEF